MKNVKNDTAEIHEHFFHEIKMSQLSLKCDIYKNSNEILITKFQKFPKK